MPTKYAIYCDHESHADLLHACAGSIRGVDPEAMIMHLLPEGCDVKTPPDVIRV